MGKVPGGPGGRRLGSGRPAIKHGGYSLMVRSGDLPERRSYLRTYLTRVRAGLIRDLGPTEEDLSTAEVILVDRIVSKLSILRCVEEHVREVGVFDKGGELVPVLGRNYLSWANSIRLDLQALGIDKRAGADVLDLGRYLESKAAAERGATVDKGGEKIGVEARSGKAVSGSLGENLKNDAFSGDGQAAGSGEIGQPGRSHSESQGVDADSQPENDGAAVEDSGPGADAGELEDPGPDEDWP